MKRKQLSMLGMTLFFALTLLGASTVQADWTAGTAGNVSLGTYQVADSTPVTIQLTGLSTASGFGLKIAHKTTDWINFTTGASQDTAYYTVVLEKPSNSNQVIITLYGIENNTHDGATSLDEAVIYIYEAASLIPTGFFLPIGVALILIGIVVSIAVALMYIKKRR